MTLKDDKKTITEDGNREHQYWIFFLVFFNFFFRKIKDKSPGRYDGQINKRDNFLKYFRVSKLHVLLLTLFSRELKK